MTTFTLYKGKNGDTYLRALGKGRIKMDGGEGYRKKGTLLRTLWKTIHDVQLDNFVIEDRTGPAVKVVHYKGE